jgi:ethanolamine utilization protein EutN
MYIARVVGDVVSSVKHEHLKGRKLLLVHPMKPEGTLYGDPLIALDMVESGVGDRVLIVDQGTATRQVLDVELPTVRTVILGIIDRIDYEEGA